MLDEIIAASQTFNIMPHMIALVVAYVLALPIGWDRESEERSAGIRTFPLVAIARRVFAILGDPISQAGSPTLFNSEFRRRNLPCVLVPLHVEAKHFEEIFRALWAINNVDGLVLTVPHNIDVLSLIDEVGPAGCRMSAVNAVRRLPDRRLVGDNFDGAGFIAGLRSRGFQVAGRPSSL